MSDLTNNIHRSCVVCNYMHSYICDTQFALLGMFTVLCKIGSYLAICTGVVICTHASVIHTITYYDTVY